METTQVENMSAIMVPESVTQFNMVLPEGYDQPLVFKPINAFEWDKMFVMLLEENNVTSSGLHLAQEKHVKPNICIALSGEMKGQFLAVPKHKMVKFDHPDGRELHIVDVNDVFGIYE